MDRTIAFAEENVQHAANIEDLLTAYHARMCDFSAQMDGTDVTKGVRAQMIAKKFGENELFWSSLDLNEVHFYDNLDKLMADHQKAPFRMVIGSSNLAHIMIEFVKLTCPKTFFMIYGPSFVRGLDWTDKVDGHILRAPNLEIPNEGSLGYPIRDAYKGYYNSLMRVLTCPDITSYAFRRDYDCLRGLFPETDSEGRKTVEFFENDRR